VHPWAFYFVYGGYKDPQLMLQLLQFAVSWALLALIWIVQLVHYPAFEYIDPERFAAFQLHHTRSITYVVAPLMLAELGITSWLVYQNQFQLQYLLILTIVLLIWASTFFIQVPVHNALMEGKDEGLIRRLVQTNWIRTILWSLKALLVSWQCWRQFGA
jgi:hypothetical protein